MRTLLPSPGHVWKRNGPSLKSGAVTISGLRPALPDLLEDGRKRIRFSGSKRKERTGETYLYVSPVFLFQRYSVVKVRPPFLPEPDRRGL